MIGITARYPVISPLPFVYPPSELYCPLAFCSTSILSNENKAWKHYGLFRNTPWSCFEIQIRGRQCFLYLRSLSAHLCFSQVKNSWVPTGQRKRKQNHSQHISFPLVPNHLNNIHAYRYIKSQTTSAEMKQYI